VAYVQQTEFGASNSNNQNMNSDLYPISHQTMGGGGLQCI